MQSPSAHHGGLVFGAEVVARKESEMQSPSAPQPPAGYVDPKIRRDFALAKLLEIAVEIAEACKPAIAKALKEAEKH